MEQRPWQLLLPWTDEWLQSTLSLSRACLYSKHCERRCSDSLYNQDAKFLKSFLSYDKKLDFWNLETKQGFVTMSDDFWR